jgi:predicted nuclease of restriction endonuclease-like (RecB) superfamily
MAKTINRKDSELLIEEIKRYVEEGRQSIAYSANATMNLVYWKIGKRIAEEILDNKRGAYGEQIVVTLSRQLTKDYGRSFEEKNIRRMIQFSSVFPDETIVVTLSRQLSWSHIIALIPLKKPFQREFYAEMCRIEGWGVKTLRQKIDGMLYERTAISKKPDKLILEEITQLREQDKLSTDLVFRDPYFLDFLGLKDTYSEKSLEDAILRELESFIMELGQGFSFVERQKRMIIDGQDYKLDLLFYHRKLKRLIAIDLKLGKFKAGYKSEMELYLRWLEKNEMQNDEETPLGLILCAEGNKEQIEYLQLHKSGIKVAEYLTQLPPKELLVQKLHKAMEIAKTKNEERD